MSELFDKEFLRRLKTEPSTETAEPPEHIDPNDYSPRNLLKATVRYPNGKLAEMVCRRHKHYRQFLWFISDTFYGLLPISDLNGESLEESEAEFEMFFGVEYSQEYAVRATWYRCSNTW